MRRYLEYQIFSNDSGSRLVATVWVDLQKDRVVSDPPEFVNELKYADIDGYTLDNPWGFMDRLPKLYRSGYRSAIRVEPPEAPTDPAEQ